MIQRVFLAVGCFLSLSIPLVASHASSLRWVTAYVTDWDSQRMRVEEIEWAGLTHIVHFNIDPHTQPPWYTFPHGQDIFEEGCWGGCNPPYRYQRRLIDSAHAHGVKAILCLGGVGGPGVAAWQWLTQDSSRCQVAVDSMLAYARRKGYDGVDVDWETPQLHERNQFSLLLRLLRRGLDAWNPRGTLCIAAPREYDPAFDVAVINATVDQFNLMSYDCNGWWSSATGFHAPLYNPAPNWPNYPLESGALNINDKAPTWVQQGLRAEIIGIGLAFYGYSYDNCTQPGQHGSNFSYMRHYQIVNDYLLRGVGTRRYDTLAHQPFLSVTSGSPTKFINYDDEVSLSVKVNWVKSSPFGGVMIFDMNSAYDPSRPAGQRHPLMRAVSQALGPTAPIGTFTADRDTLPAEGGAVTLSWTSANATLASIDQGIGDVPVSGTRTVTVRRTTLFTLTLTNSVGTQSYTVRVVVRGSDGPSGDVPKDYSLGQNFPNPFNPGTKILLAVPRDSRVTLTIFDMLGKPVRTLVSGILPAGTHEVRWDGANDRGEPLPSGVYFYTATAGNFVETRKMLLLR